MKIFIKNKNFVFQERRNVGTASSRNRFIKRKTEHTEEDDEDDDDEKNEKDDTDKIEENVSNIRERRFREFASVEYDDEIYMVNEFCIYDHSNK